MNLDPNKFYWVDDVFGRWLVKNVRYRGDRDYQLSGDVLGFEPNTLGETAAPTWINGLPFRPTEVYREATPEEVMRVLL